MTVHIYKWIPSEQQQMVETETGVESTNDALKISLVTANAAVSGDVQGFLYMKRQK